MLIRLSALLRFLAVVLLANHPSPAQSTYEPYFFSTLSPLSGTGSADGTGSEARFNAPADVTVDSAGNVYVADTLNHAIRKITPAGEVTTLAGCPACGPGSTDGTGKAAGFNSPLGVAVGQAGEIYVADTSNYTIRKVTADGLVTTLAGKPGVAVVLDGIGRAARFGRPTAIAADRAGTVYVADSDTTIRKLTPLGMDDWMVTTLAGRENHWGTLDGTGPGAWFAGISSLALDAAGNIYAAADAIRRITPAGEVTTLGNLRGSHVTMDVARDHLYFTDNGTAVWRATFSAGDWTAAPFAGMIGSANYGSTDGTGSAARLNGAWGLAADGAGNIYFADRKNNAIRKVTAEGVVTTVAGLSSYGSTDGPASIARFDSIRGLAVDSQGRVFLADSGNHTIRQLSPVGSDWVATTLAGFPSAPGSTDGLGSNARFNRPTGVAVDASGTIYVTDAGSAIRKLSRTGVDWEVTTLAGLAGETGHADGTGSAARFDRVLGVAVDSRGDLYVADTGNKSIRKVTRDGLVTTLAGTTAGGNKDGTGDTARFGALTGIAVDAAGNVYVADEINNSVRKVTPAGEVTTLAGPTRQYPGPAGNADGLGSAAQFSGPQALAIDGSGNLYVSDRFNRSIRKVTPGGAVTTLAVNPGQNPLVGTLCGLAADLAGNLYLADLWNAIRKGSPGPTITTSGLRLRSNGSEFGFALQGPAGQRIVLEASTDLIDWLPVWTNTLQEVTGFSDSENAAAGHRFYRINLR